MWTGWSLPACASEYPLEAGICGLGNTGLLFQAGVVCGMGPCTGCDCACNCPDVGVKTVIFSMMKLVVEEQSPTIACNNALHLDFKSNFLALITISQQCLNFSRKKKAYVLSCHPLLELFQYNKKEHFSHKTLAGKVVVYVVFF